MQLYSSLASQICTILTLTLFFLTLPLSSMQSKAKNQKQVIVKLRDKNFIIPPKVLKDTVILRDIIDECSENEQGAKKTSKKQIIDITSGCPHTPQEFALFLDVIEKKRIKYPFSNIQLDKLPMLFDLANRFNNEKALIRLSQKFIHKINDLKIKQFLSGKGFISSLLIAIPEDIQEYYLKKLFIEKYKKIEQRFITHNVKKLNDHKDCLGKLFELNNGNLISFPVIGDVKIWNSDGVCIKTITLDKKGLQSVIKLNNGFIAFLYSFNKTIGILNPTNYSIRRLNGHSKDVTRIIELQNGTLASCSDDNTIKIWDKEGNCITTWQYCDNDKNTTPKLLELKNGNLVSSHYSYQNIYNVIKIWQPDGQLIAKLNGHTEYIYDFIELDDGNIASSSHDNTIKIWNSSGKCIKTLSGHSHAPRFLCKLQNNRFASTSYGKTIKIWHNNGDLITTINPQYEVRAVIRLKNGNMASCCCEKKLTVWTPEGKCLLNLPGHSKGINPTLELSNGNLVTGGCDTIIKIWPINIFNKLNFQQLLLVIGLHLKSSGGTAKIDLNHGDFIPAKQIYGTLSKEHKGMVKDFILGE